VGAGDESSDAGIGGAGIGDAGAVAAIQSFRSGDGGLVTGAGRFIAEIQFGNRT